MKFLKVGALTPLPPGYANDFVHDKIGLYIQNMVI